MKSKTRGQVLLLLFLVIPIALFFVWRNSEEQYHPLPIMGTYYSDTSVLSDKDFMDSTFHGNYFVENDSVYEMWTLRDFSLIDHTGDSIDLSDFDDKIIVANFFYATCPELCPRMNNNLRLVVEAFKDNPEVVFLSHTVHPEHDSVPILAEYAKRYGYANNKWYFATGFKHEIYDLATSHYHAAAPSPDGQYDFIHSTMVYIVDKDRRMRGYHESRNNPQFAKELKDAVKVLLAEYHQNEKFVQ
ncbi:MAG: SCO family protein [Bacteroidia bacterium]|nr:SCO family protein [Bacteroidia bacterium]